MVGTVGGEMQIPGSDSRDLYMVSLFWTKFQEV